MKLKNVILSWDIIFSISITLVALYFSQYSSSKMLVEAFRKFTDIGVTIFSVIFPLFFAALTIIITASDDDFAAYLEKKGYLKQILASFKFTLVIIFITFLYSITLYTLLDYVLMIPIKVIVYIITCLYLFFFMYSLSSVLNSILDSMNYARLRGDYFKKKNK